MTQGEEKRQINKSEGNGISTMLKSNENNILFSSDNENLIYNQTTTQIEPNSIPYPQKLIASNQLPSSQTTILQPISTILPPTRLSKKTLVLDLDETLIHSSCTLFNCPSDAVITITVDNQLHDIQVLYRPGLDDFIKKMAAKYELIIFTASVSKYAEPLISLIDKRGDCAYKFFREQCVVNNGSFTKDLRQLNRNMKDIIILDNSPLSYALNNDNGLPILSWFDDKTDCELINIIPMLEFLSTVPDVREYIPKIIVNNEISYTKAKEVMNQYSQSNNNNTDNSSVKVEVKVVVVESMALKLNRGRLKKKTSLKHTPMSLESNGGEVKIKKRSDNTLLKSVYNSVLPMIKPPMANSKSKQSIFSNNKEISIKQNLDNINLLRVNATSNKSNCNKNNHYYNQSTHHNLHIATSDHFTKEALLYDKHKKIESFTFGPCQYSYNSHIKTRTNLDLNNHLPLKQKSNNDPTVLNHQHNHISHHHPSRRLISQDLSKQFKTVKSMHLDNNNNHNNIFSRALMIANVPMSKVFCSNSGVSDVNSICKLGVESFKSNDFIKNTTKPFSVSINQNRKMVCHIIDNSFNKKSSKNKEKKIDINEYMKQYQSNRNNAISTPM